MLRSQQQKPNNNKQIYAKYITMVRFFFVHYIEWEQRVKRANKTNIKSKQEQKQEQIRVNNQVIADNSKRANKINIKSEQEQKKEQIRVNNNKESKQ